MRISILYPFPFPGMNEVISMAKVPMRGRKGGRKQNFYSVTKANLTHSCCQIALAHFRENALAYPIKVSVKLHFLWKITSNRDPDNVTAGEKFIIDGLVWAKILENDGAKQIKGIYHDFRIVPRPQQDVTLSIILRR